MAANHKSGWTEPSSPPTLNPQDVHVWRIDITAFESKQTRLLARLSADEQQRAERMRIEEKKLQYIVGRAALRNILASYLDTTYDKISFDYGPQKKPTIANQDSRPPDQRIEFNLSHSGKIVLIALTRNKPIGIDIEYKETDRADEKIAQRYFSSEECRALSKLEAADRIDGFYRCWTSKEAFVKALGDGLTFPLDAFDVALTDQQRRILAIRNAQEKPEAWSLKAFDAEHEYEATCAVKGVAINWSQYAWNPNSIDQ
jgi:4'-phosphopantetheinyl transferase